MKPTLVFYLKLLLPVFLADFFLIVTLPLLLPGLQGHLVLLNILVCILFVWILSYLGSLRTRMVSTGIFAALIYALVWRYVLSVLFANLLGVDYYAVDALTLKNWLLGVLIIFFIGMPIVSLFSWPTAYLGCKRANREGEMLLPSQEKGQKPWGGIAFLFYIRTVVILYVLFTLYGMWIHKAFRCSFAAWSLPSCSYQSGVEFFLGYLFILLFFNAALMCIDIALSRKNSSSKTMFMLDFALALPAYLLTGITQAIICSLPFIARISAVGWNEMKRNSSKQA
jgi:hypothetical protein